MIEKEKNYTIIIFRDMTVFEKNPKESTDKILK